MEEFKAENGFSKTLRDKEKQVAAFKKKQKEGAKSVLNSMANQSNEALRQSVFMAWIELIQEMQLLIFSMCQWKKDARVERIRRMGKEKDAKRKKELVGVKHMFKNFAGELETSLASGTPRTEAPKKRSP